jgi:hypothetical protein
MTKLPTHICESHELSDKLLELLAAAPSTVDDLVRFTGYSSSMVRARLNDLRSTGRAYRKSEPSPIWGGLQHVWHIGTTTVAMPALPRARDLGASVMKPRQATVKDYPAFHHRHWMDVALFGPAQREVS